MLEKLRVVFTIPELRQKIFLTLFLLAVYRVGWQIPLPIIDQEKMAQYAQGSSGAFSQFLTNVSVFSASQLNQATIFGLGIMPYISASIILQLLGSVYKPLEELKKEGEAGRKKINEYTRYLTVVLCLIQSTAFLWFYIMAPAAGATYSSNLVADQFEAATQADCRFGWQILSVMMMTCGTIFLMWLGEQIDEYGIGNGISLLIMAGIVAQMPGALNPVDFRSQFRIDRNRQWPDRYRNVYRADCAICGCRVGSGVYYAGPKTYPHPKRQTRSWSKSLRWYSSVYADSN